MSGASDLFSWFEGLFWFFFVTELLSLVYLFGRTLGSLLLGLEIARIQIGFGSSRVWSGTVGNIPIVICGFPFLGIFSLRTDFDFSRSRKSFLRILSHLFGPLTFFIFAFLILFSSFLLHGDSPNTMQIVETSADGDARRAGFERGDIILSVNGEEISKFEMGIKAISRYPKTRIPIQVERKTGWISFTDLKTLMDYLQTQYGHKHYIRITTPSLKVPALFYAREPALEFLQRIDKTKILVEISTDRENLTLEVTPDENGRIGIGIKPYSIDGKTVYPGFFTAATLAGDYTFVLVLQFFRELWDVLISFFSQGDLPVEINLFQELWNFSFDFQEIGGNEFLKLFSMLSLSAGIFFLMPLPMTAGYYIFEECMFLFCFILPGFLLKKEEISVDSRMWIKGIYWLFASLFLLLIFLYSLPNLSS